MKSYARVRKKSEIERRRIDVRTCAKVVIAKDNLFFLQVNLLGNAEKKCSEMCMQIRNFFEIKETKWVGVGLIIVPKIIIIIFFVVVAQ